MPKHRESETDKLDISAVSLDKTADPFATDLFSHETSVFSDSIETEDEQDPGEAANESGETIEEAVAWYRDLPKMSAATLKNIDTFLFLPALFSQDITDIVLKTIEQYVVNGESQVACEIVSSEETDLIEECAKLSSEETVFVTFASQPSESKAALAIESNFAANLVKTALVSSSGELERRQLSPTELAILEFFALCCLSEINKSFSEPLFSLKETAQKIPVWLQKKGYDDRLQPDRQMQSGLLQKIRLQIGDEISLLQLFMPFEFLRSLNETKNQLLVRGGRDAQAIRFKNIVTGFKLRTILGETALDSGELAYLETGDTVIIEQSSVQFDNSKISGSVQVRIGEEPEGSLYGVLASEDSLHLTVREISQNNKTNRSKRLNMDENELIAEGEQTEGLALEKIFVTVKVEIASRRMSLAELAQIRTGQTIDLECKATDPVELVADGRTIAIGNLVDLEGQLGVRLTKVSLLSQT